VDGNPVPKMLLETKAGLVSVRSLLGTSLAAGVGRLMAARSEFAQQRSVARESDGLKDQAKRLETRLGELEKKLETAGSVERVELRAEADAIYHLLSTFVKAERGVSAREADQVIGERRSQAVIDHVKGLESSFQEALEKAPAGQRGAIEAKLKLCGEILSRFEKAESDPSGRGTGALLREARGLIRQLDALEAAKGGAAPVESLGLAKALGARMERIIGARADAAAKGQAALEMRYNRLLDGNEGPAGLRERFGFGAYPAAEKAYATAQKGAGTEMLAARREIIQTSFEALKARRDEAAKEGGRSSAEYRDLDGAVRAMARMIKGLDRAVSRGTAADARLAFNRKDSLRASRPPAGGM
jgi:hypothetical protein